LVRVFLNEVPADGAAFIQDEAVVVLKTDTDVISKRK
jgi:hypothetical protein